MLTDPDVDTEFEPVAETVVVLDGLVVVVEILEDDTVALDETV